MVSEVPEHKEQEESSQVSLDPLLILLFCADPSRMGHALEPQTLMISMVCLVTLMDEADIATYTIKTIHDPQTLNKTLYLRPPENALTQKQLVEMSENLLGKKLVKITISKQDFLASIKGMDYASKVGVGHFYHIFYESDLTNFEIKGEGVEEASKLYPEVKYTRIDEYLKVYA